MTMSRLLATNTSFTTRAFPAGRNAAVAEIGSKHVPIQGVFAFAAWLGVHALLPTTARAKMEVLFEWAWDYFGETRVAPILDQPDQERQFPDRPPQEERPS
jgi:hypothetical protein